MSSHSGEVQPDAPSEPGEVPEPEREGVERLRRWFEEHDEEALEALLRDELPWLRRYVSARLSDHLRRFEGSEDVVQNALLQLLRSGPRFLPQTDTQLRGLLARIVYNRILDLAKYADADARNAHVEEPLPTTEISRIGPAEGSSAGPVRTAEKEEERTRVRLAMVLLEPSDRELLVMHRFEGLGFTEIGARLGISASAATKRHERAVIRLGRQMRCLRSGDLGALVEEVQDFVGLGASDARGEGPGVGARDGD